MRMVLLLVLVLVGLVPASAACVQPTVSIALEKPSFLVGEPIWVSILVTNETSQEFVIPSVNPHDQFLEFVLRSPEGERVRYWGPLDSTGRRHLLGPEDSAAHEFNLLDAYAWPEHNRTPGKEPREMKSLRAGTYTLTAYLRVAEQYPASLYARLALMRAADVSRFFGQQRSSRQDLQRALEEYDLVVERYPGTREAEEALESGRVVRSRLETTETVTVRIRLEKSAFLPAEPIVVQIIVENDTAWPIAVPTFDPANGFLSGDNPDIQHRLDALPAGLPHGCFKSPAYCLPAI